MHDVQCAGWWEQAGYGRQPMHELRLCFGEDRIVGRGVDVIGRFTLDGAIRHSVVTLVKRYEDAHSVDYSGTFDGEGTLQGMWSISGFGGRWLIRVVAVDAPTVDLQDL